MDETLRALGLLPSRAHRAELVVLVVGWTAMLLGVGVAAHTVFGVEPLLVHVVFWLVWLWWLGSLFGKHRNSDTTRYGNAAFGKAFCREILFGIACSFAQMLRPLAYGVMDHGLAKAVSPLAQLGLPLVVLGCVLIGLAMEILGVDGAIFLREYQTEPRITRKGIYGYLRHPLFFGAIIASVGGALTLGGRIPLQLAAANLLVLPVYRRLEDRRCLALFGDTYRDYKLSVGAFAPRWQRMALVLRLGELR